ncbi:MAG: GntR family transcriptional regulator [Betaproteobacteria bacterium]|nr:GntR family transcriptional regulator [Betaproteobacteria bacterium]
MLDSLQLDIQPVLVPKASNVLADHLRQQILDGKLVQGTPLPNERDLAIQTQLSRASVREAYTGFVFNRS